MHEERNTSESVVHTCTTTLLRRANSKVLNHCHQHSQTTPSISTRTTIYSPQWTLRIVFTTVHKTSTQVWAFCKSWVGWFCPWNFPPIFWFRLQSGKSLYGVAIGTTWTTTAGPQCFVFFCIVEVFRCSCLDPFAVRLCCVKNPARQSSQDVIFCCN